MWFYLWSALPGSTTNQSNRQLFHLPGLPLAISTKLVHLQRRAWHSYQLILGGRLGRRILRGEQTIADGVLLPRCPRRTTATIPASSTFHQCSTVLERRQKENDFIEWTTRRTKREKVYQATAAARWPQRSISSGRQQTVAGTYH